MKEQKISFSAEMVQAILVGRKTQTRRPIKDMPSMLPGWWKAMHWASDGHFIKGAPHHCPIGKPGDQLFVEYKSIYSPRLTSRINLEITSVRVERLHEITPEDCLWEGIHPEKQQEWIGKTLPGKEYKSCRLSPLQRAFAALWQAIYPKKDQTWDDNPWVWVVEFKRVTA